MSETNFLGSKLIVSKENMRKNIRHALTSKSQGKFPNIDLNTPLFEPIPDLLSCFAKQYRTAGGKLIICTKDNFIQRLVELIKILPYNQILSTKGDLSKILEQANISFQKCIDVANPADIAVVYSDVLIARSGSLLFSQKYSLYPSVKNLAKDIIVVAFTNRIVADLKTAFEVQEKLYKGKNFEFFEIITPSPPVVNEIKEEIYSPTEPRFILFLIT